MKKAKRGQKKSVYLTAKSLRELKSCVPWLSSGSAEGVVRGGDSAVIQWCLGQANKARLKGLSPKDVERLIAEPSSK